MNIRRGLWVVRLISNSKHSTITSSHHLNINSKPNHFNTPHQSTCLILVGHLPFYSFFDRPTVSNRNLSLGRKSLGDQVGDKLKPDSQKSTTEKVGDTMSGMGDRVAGAVQPE